MGNNNKNLSNNTSQNSDIEKSKEYNCQFHARAIISYIYTQMKLFDVSHLNFNIDCKVSLLMGAMDVKSEHYSDSAMTKNQNNCKTTFIMIFYNFWNIIYNFIQREINIGPSVSVSLNLIIIKKQCLLKWWMSDVSLMFRAVDWNFECSKIFQSWLKLKPDFV